MAEKQSNKERIKEITAGIEKGIMELFESDRYRNYLTTMSRFHRYSLNNVMLIHAQRPDATLVAGFSKWKNSFGRHVKKGEKGIQILAPTPYKIKVDKEKLDPDTKLPMLDDEGKPITEEKEVTITNGLIMAQLLANFLRLIEKKLAPQLLCLCVLISPTC